MLRRAIRLKPGAEDDGADSGAETAESDCSKMSSISSDFIVVESQDLLLMTMHLLANPGESFLLQQSLDLLLKWVSPDLHLFHVSERATPVKHCEKYCRKTLLYPSLSVILFLHEDFGEERIFQLQDFFQRPPWQYHHSESASGKILPYLLSSQDFYSLDTHMPVWAVRQVHYGNEIIRVTLYCSYDNYEDTVRMYETILQNEANAQKNGFCYFTLYTDKSLSIQLSLKQLSPGVSVDLKESAVLQFRIQEIGQLVPLLPNPCAPISSTRWQTEDYDGNKIIFQVKGNSQSHHKTSSAFQVHSKPVSMNAPRSLMPCNSPAYQEKWTPLHTEREASGAVQRPGKHKGGGCGISSKNEGFCSDSCCSTPRSSSCYSSQRSSPATLSQCELSCERRNTLSSGYKLHDSKLKAPEEPETNVDTGFAVVSPETIAGHGTCPLNGFSKDLFKSLPDPRTCTGNTAVLSTTGSLSSTSLISSSVSPRTHKPSPSACIGTNQEIALHQIQAKHLNVLEDEFFI
ncbi:protein FAM124B-like isoform X1 [Acipenser ruthenus]|uniref:protein FAM124B-like isoform X1 n=1 Tax=Acipenser ruthenus TaxID=7906 RepID=UPI00156028BA|nr:protein FAM124B-like isoform X1 [Acipenser ruthenus]